MIEMKVREEDIGNVFGIEAVSGKTLFKRIIAVHVIIAEELFVLLCAHAIINKNAIVAVLNKEATHRPRAHVVIVSRIGFIPQAFGYYAEHGASVEHKVACVYGVEFHVGWSWMKLDSVGWSLMKLDSVG